MESNKIMQADILDILFDGRNKEYGAYDLRKTYNRRLYKAIGVTGTVILLVLVGGIVSGRGSKKMAVIPIIIDSVQLTPLDPNEPPPPPPPPPPQVPLPQVKMIDFTPPKIVPADQVNPEDVPPVQDDITDAKIGTVNTPGNADVGTVGPTAPSDGDRGIVEPPKKKDPDDEITLVVEIDATYPGGMQAWQRFMNKSFRYPDDAQAQEIDGTVVVQFVVDSKGNVSDVQAISGPEKGGLREEAVRVIKKSGLWVPAIQNGRSVKAYKRQPIVFKITQG